MKRSSVDGVGVGVVAGPVTDWVGKNQYAKKPPKRRPQQRHSVAAPRTITVIIAGEKRRCVTGA